MYHSISEPNVSPDIISTINTSSNSHKIIEEYILLTYNPILDRDICIEHGIGDLALIKQTCIASEASLQKTK